MCFKDNLQEAVFSGCKSPNKLKLLHLQTFYKLYKRQDKSNQVSYTCTSCLSLQNWKDKSTFKCGECKLLGSQKGVRISAFLQQSGVLLGTWTKKAQHDENYTEQTPLDNTDINDPSDSSRSHLVRIFSRKLEFREQVGNDGFPAAKLGQLISKDSSSSQQKVLANLTTDLCTEPTDLRLSFGRPAESHTLFNFTRNFASSWSTLINKRGQLRKKDKNTFDGNSGDKKNIYIFGNCKRGKKTHT